MQNIPGAILQYVETLYGEEQTKLRKAVDSADIQALLPESLEQVAHSLLWKEDDPNELTMLRLLPAQEAKQLFHEVPRITSYGDERAAGFFGATTTPPPTKSGSDRLEFNLKPFTSMTEVLLIAALQQVVNVNGSTNAADYEPAMNRLLLLRQLNRAIYFADNSKSAAGDEAGLIFRGLLQQIREGTDGTVGDASPYGSHVVDMAGQPITPDTLRERAADVLTLFGFPRILTMAPHARTHLEGLLDPTFRANLSTGPLQTFKLGGSVAGFESNGRRMVFQSDNSLSYIYAQPKYKSTRLQGAPTIAPTVSAVAASYASSNWDSASADNWFWVIAPVRDGIEGPGTRYPSGSAYTAVAAGDRVTVTITTADTGVDHYNVYRGKEGWGSASTDAYLIDQVAADDSGTTTYYDNNDTRPRTTCAFGLDVSSPLLDALHWNGGSMWENYQHVRASNHKYSKVVNNDSVVGMAHLGPRFMQINLAHIVPTVQRPMNLSVGSPVIRNPYKCVAFKNVGAG